MKYSLFFFACFVLLCSCRDDGVDCPYENKWGNRHFIQIPVTATPNKKSYKIGDTIVFSSNFPDSILDINTDQTFKIEGFPFRPYSYLYRFGNDTIFRHGYTANEVHVPDENNPSFTYESQYTDAIYAQSVYRDEGYYFQIELVLQTTGKYVFLQRDWYNDVRVSGREGNEEADAIEFEGKCFEGFIPVVMQTGPDHVSQFYDELYSLDENVYRGLYSDREGGENYADGSNLDTGNGKAHTALR